LRGGVASGSEHERPVATLILVPRLECTNRLPDFAGNPGVITKDVC